MKKQYTLIPTILFFLIILSSCGGSGCNDVEVPASETPVHISETEQTQSPPELTPIISYTGLTYRGLDTNPLQQMINYSVEEDKEFVSKIYGLIDYENHIPCEGPSTANVTIDLEFSAENGVQFLCLDPNDLAWTRPENDPYGVLVYFSLPEGTYKKISSLLTEYTQMHFMPNVSTEILHEMVQNSDILTFSCNEAYFKVPTKNADGFPDDFLIDGWKEYTPADGALTGRAIHISDESYTYNVIFFVDLCNVEIRREGVSAWYTFSRETAEIIWNWYEEMEMQYSD